jgi:hypothetical protein
MVDSTSLGYQIFRDCSRSFQFKLRIRYLANGPPLELFDPSSQPIAFRHNIPHRAQISTKFE